MKTFSYFNNIQAGPPPDQPGHEDYFNGQGEGLVLPDGTQRFFSDNARKFVVGVMSWARSLPPEDQNMETVYKVIRSEGEALKTFAQAMYDTGPPLAQDGAAPYLKDEPNRGDLESLSTARVQLSFLAVPELRRVLSGPSSFNLRDLKRGNMAIFLAMPEDQAKRYSTFTRMLYAALFNACLTTPRAPVTFVMDELATSLGGATLPQVETAFAFGSGYGLRVLGVFQNYPQACAVFGQKNAEALLACAGTQCWLTPNDPLSCDVIAKRGGERLGLDVQFDPVRQAWQPTGRGVGIPIFRAHDLYGFPRNKLILFRENCAQAITAYRRPYFRIPMVDAVASVNPFAPPSARKAGKR